MWEDFAEGYSDHLQTFTSRLTKLSVLTTLIKYSYNRDESLMEELKRNARISRIPECNHAVDLMDKYRKKFECESVNTKQMESLMNLVVRKIYTYLSK